MLFETIFDFIVVGGFLTVFWYWLFRRDKLFAFEDKIFDKIAWLCAQVIIFKRRTFKKIRKIHRNHI